MGRLVGFTIENIPAPELKSIQRLAAKKSFMKIEQETLGGWLAEAAKCNAGLFSSRKIKASETGNKPGKTFPGKIMQKLVN